MAKQMPVQYSNYGSERTFGYQPLINTRYFYPTHIHQFVELTLMVSGSLTVTVRGRRETATDGQFIFITPFETHSYHSNTENTFYIYTFSPSLISDFIKLNKGAIGDRSVFDASEASMELFRRRLIEDRDFSEYSIRSCLYSMLSDREKQVKDSAESIDGMLISRIINEINSRITEPLPLTEVARAIGYSANYLSHCIKSSVGMNYSAFLSCLRCEIAKERLSETEDSVLSVALECGFGSERNFHRQFKALTGKTPREYRAARKLRAIEKS